jgi:hypothetical protein
LGEEAFLPTFPQPGMGTDHLWSVDEDSTMSYAQPFQDVFLSSLDTFDTELGRSNSNFTAQPEANLNDNVRLPHFQGEAPNTSLQHLQSLPKDISQRQQALIDHFVHSANPVAVILPTHDEWASACRSLLAMASGAEFLFDAICSLSALHLCAMRSEDSYEEASRYYKTSTRQANKVLDQEHVGDQQLKRAFATVFLLTHAEVSLTDESLLWFLQNVEIISIGELIRTPASGTNRHKRKIRILAFAKSAKSSSSSSAV